MIDSFGLLSVVIATIWNSLCCFIFTCWRWPVTLTFYMYKIFFFVSLFSSPPVYSECVLLFRLATRLTLRSSFVVVVDFLWLLFAVMRGALLLSDEMLFAFGWLLCALKLELFFSQKKKKNFFEIVWVIYQKIFDSYFFYTAQHLIS